MVNTKELVASTATKAGYSEPLTSQIISTFLERIKQGLLNGAKVKLAKLGTLHIEPRNIGQSAKRAKALNGTVLKTKFAASRTFKNVIAQHKESILSSMGSEELDDAE